ncbi:hypothetical protein AX17_007020 [Amanita inopinata Kibby_2008]|nr:hypothetical protein AX17_007020 [Amanita inopinata Kibby_2008]
MSNNHDDEERVAATNVPAEAEARRSEKQEEEETGGSASSNDSDSEQSTSPDAMNNVSGEEKGKGVASTGAWQAIYSPQYNVYYFYNAETQETTWTNPLAHADSASASASTSSDIDTQNSMSSAGLEPQYTALQQAAMAQGIDPSLAYLDPSLASSVPSTSAAPGTIPSFTAKFNARTGQFTRPDGRDPTHLSEYERMKRMSDFYFDVNSWEQDLAAQGGSIKGDELTKKRKRPSKKDLVSPKPCYIF